MKRNYSSLHSLREVVEIFWRDTDRFVKLQVAAALLLVLAVSALSPLGPLALKLLIDRFTGDVHWSLYSVALLIALYVLSQWLTRCLGAVRGLLYGNAQNRTCRVLSERVFAHIMQLPMKFHMNRHTGALGQILEDGTQGYEAVLQSVLFSLLPLIIQFSMVSVVLMQFKQSAFLGIFFLAAICYGAAFYFFTARLIRDAKAESNAHIDATAIMTDSLINYEVIKYFAAEPVVRERVGHAFLSTEKSRTRIHRRSALNAVYIGSIFAVFLTMSTVYAAYLVKTGQMTAGDFVLVNAYMLQLMAPLESLGSAIQSLSQGIATLARMLELLREKPEPQQFDDHRPLQSAGDLRFDHVCLSYRPGRTVIRDVSFHLPSGKTLGVVGASGAGKSTLIRLLVRLFEADSGSILLDGIPISEVPLSKLRRAIAIVPQDTILFNESIAYNIGFGKHGSAKHEIEQAAKIANLHDFIVSLPEGYETMVGERGVKLSGGEKQRVSIARAAIKKPRMYVFDEATSSLDSRTEKEILLNLQDMSRSSTTLIIAHRLSTVVHADEIIVLDQGSIIERGAHASLLALKGRYTSLWKAQQEIGANRQRVISLG